MAGESSWQQGLEAVGHISFTVENQTLATNMYFTRLPFSVYTAQNPRVARSSQLNKCNQDNIPQACRGPSPKVNLTTLTITPSMQGPGLAPPCPPHIHNYSNPS